MQTGLCLTMKVSRTIIGSIITLAAVVGLIAQDLLIAPTIGLNLSLLCITTSFGALILEQKRILKYSFERWMLHAPLWIAAYGFGFVASTGLDAANLLLLTAMVGWLALRSCKEKALTLVESLAVGPLTALITPFVVFLLPSVTAPSTRVGTKKSISKGGLVGAAVALPVVLIFGSILASADPVFGNAVTFNPNINFDDLGLRGFIFAATSASLCGALALLSKDLAPAIRNTFSGSQLTPAIYVSSAGKHIEVAGPIPPRPSRNANQDSISAFVTFFGCIGSLFLVFILFQARYLFGGHQIVLNTANLSYADYARRGFFELVGITFTTLPMLAFWQESLQTADDRLRRPVKVVVLVMSSLLGLMLFSAAFRMNLYIASYGLSPLRFLVAAAIVWLFTVIAGYGYLGSRWKLSHYPRVIYLSLMTVVLAANFIRPDRLIADVNLARKVPDLAMVTQLEFDANEPIMRLGTPEIKSQWTSLRSKSSKNWRGKSWQEAR